MRLSSFLVATTVLLAGSAFAGLEDVKSSVKLTGSNFDSKIAGKNSLVAFFAPWCGHCKSLAPTWEGLGKTFESEENVVIGHFDADNGDNRPVAARYGVKGYPTIKFFPADGSAPVDYQSARSEDAFIEFINKEAGTYRSKGGLLSNVAGRLPSLDEIAATYLSTKNEARDAIVAKARALAGEIKGSKVDATAASYYVKVMEKLASSSDWATNELARLQKLASKKGAMAGKQLDDLQLRQNILQAFTSAKVAAYSVASDASASAQSAASGVSASVGSAASVASASASSALNGAGNAGAVSSISASGSSAVSSVSASAKSAAWQAGASAVSASVEVSGKVASAASQAAATASSIRSAAASATDRIKAEL